MLTDYTFDKLTRITKYEKPFKRQKSLSYYRKHWHDKEYPMDTRARDYYHFVPVEDENGVVFKYLIKIHDHIIYEVDKNNIITWKLSWGDFNSGTTRILNNGRSSYYRNGGEGYVEQKSNKGGVCFTIYDKQDNPKYKDYMGNILNKYASPHVYKIKEIYPLKAEMQYQIDGKTIKPITKYDMVIRKINKKRASATRHLKYNDKENFFSIINLLDDDKKCSELFYSLVQEVMGHPIIWKHRILTDLEISKEVEKAKKYSIVSSVFYVNYLTRSVHDDYSLSSVARWSNFAKFMWEHYMLYIYEKEDCYDKKYYPCENKKYPSSSNTKIQMRGAI